MSPLPRQQILKISVWPGAQVFSVICQISSIGHIRSLCYFISILETTLRRVSFVFYQKNFFFQSSHCGTAETNLTSILEDVGSIPGLAQWVGDPELS